MERVKKVVSVNHPIIQKKIKKALKISIHEGKYAAAEQGLSNSFLSPFVVAANVSSAQVGVFSAIINFIPGLVQMMTAKFVERTSRKRIVIPSAFSQAFMNLVLSILALLLFFGMFIPAWVIIGVASLIYIVGAPSNVAWFSWMGSLVPENERGKYFAKRNKILGLVSLITMLLGAYILDFFKIDNFVMLGFAILFFLAFIFKFISVVMVSRQYEPRLIVRKKDAFSFFHFLKSLKKNPFGRFTIYVSGFRVLWWIGAPFFVVFMLRDLGFSYFWYMITLISGIIFQLVFYPMMGKISDKFGNVRLLRLSTFLIAITPLLWIISPNKLYLIFIPQLISGIGNAGFLLASNNYIYDSLNQKKMTFGLSYFNFMSGIAIALGSGLGSLLALTNITFLGYNTLFIITLSGIARIIFVLFSKNILREVRHVEEFKYQWIIKEIKAEGASVQTSAMNNVLSTVQHVIRVKKL